MISLLDVVALEVVAQLVEVVEPVVRGADHRVHPFGRQHAVERVEEL